MTDLNPSRPPVSVLMAVHNGQRHLRQAMRGVLGQTMADFEFVVVDDRSTDATAAILDGFADGRIIRVNNLSHLGLTRSLNRGAAVCGAPLVARIDADDVCEPTRLAEQLALMRSRPELAAAATWTTEVDDDGVATGRCEPCGEHAYVAWEFFRRSVFYHPTVMMRADALRAVGGYDESMPFAQDYDLFSRLVTSGRELAILERPLVQYRRGAGSITQTRRAEQAALAGRVRERYQRHWLGEAVPAAAAVAAAAFMGWGEFDWSAAALALPLLRLQYRAVRPAAGERAGRAIDESLLAALRRRADAALAESPWAAARVAALAMSLPQQRFERAWWGTMLKSARAGLGRWRRGIA